MDAKTNKRRVRLQAMADALKSARVFVRNGSSPFICFALRRVGTIGACEAKTLVQRALGSSASLDGWMFLESGKQSSEGQMRRYRLRWIDQLVRDIEAEVAELAKEPQG